MADYFDQSGCDTIELVCVKVRQLSGGLLDMFRISLFMFIVFGMFGVVSFYLTPYLMNKGFEAGQIGTIMAVGALVSIVSQPFWGYISDKKKTVKRILLLLLICCLTASTGLFAMEHLLLIIVMYACYMFFCSPIGPLAEALSLSYAQEHRREFGRMRVWGEIGVGVSALSVGYLVKAVGIDKLWIIFLSCGAIAVMAALQLRESKVTPAPVDLKALGKLFMQRRLLWLLLIVLIVGIPHRMNDSMLSLYLKELEAPESIIGIAWFFGTMSTVPAMMFAGRLFRRWNAIGIMTIAAVVYSIRWFIYSATDSAAVLIAAQVLHGATFPLFFLATIHYMMTIVPAELRATGQSAFAVTFAGLGGLVGNAAGGYAIQLFGAGHAYAIGGALALIGAAALVGTYLYNRRL
jgi:PPP family 3-phenylpropionic acid transporter